MIHYGNFPPKVASQEKKNGNEGCIFSWGSWTSGRRRVCDPSWPYLPVQDSMIWSNECVALLVVADAVHSMNSRLLIPGKASSRHRWTARSRTDTTVLLLRRNLYHPITSWKTGLQFTVKREHFSLISPSKGFHSFSCQYSMAVLFYTITKVKIL